MNGGNSTKHNITKLREYYDNKAKKNDNKGISKSDLFTLFKEAGYLVTEQIKLDILNSLNVRNAIIDFDEFIRLWGLFHNAEDMEGDDAVNYDYIDAFVAMGGNPDTTGFVKRTKVIDVIKEFELTIDMDEFMEKIGEDEELEFDAFCQLFDKPFDDSKSMQSILSAVSEKLRRSTSSFSVRYKDFERFMAKHPDYLMF